MNEFPDEIMRNLLLQILARRARDIQLPVPSKEVDYPPVTAALHSLLEVIHKNGELILPDLGPPNGTIAIFSDYSGDCRGSDFLTYSFLFMAYNYRDAFGEEVAVLRHKFLGDTPNKEISYKDLRFGPVFRMLPDYLSALDQFVAGWLVTVAVEKRIRTVMGFEGAGASDYISNILENAGVGGWKPNVAERVLRISHLASYLAAIVVSEGQKVFWMTDNDSVVPNSVQGQRAMTIFNTLLPEYSNKKIATFGWAVPFENPKCTTHLDLLSATDLACGTLTDYLSARNTQRTTSSKTRSLLQWLSRDGSGLKKLSMEMRLLDDGYMNMRKIFFD